MRVPIFGARAPALTPLVLVAAVIAGCVAGPGQGNGPEDLPSSAAGRATTAVNAALESRSRGASETLHVAGYLTIATPNCPPSVTEIPDALGNPCFGIVLTERPLADALLPQAAFPLAAANIEADLLGLSSVEGVPVVIAGHFNDARAAQCSADAALYCAAVFVVDKVVWTGRAAHIPDASLAKSATRVTHGRSTTLVPTGWVIAREGRDLAIREPSVRECSFSIKSRPSGDPRAADGSVLSEYPDAAFVSYFAVDGVPHWTLEFGGPLRDRESRVGFYLDGEITELSFRNTCSDDSVQLMSARYREISASFHAEAAAK